MKDWIRIKFMISTQFREKLKTIQVQKIGKNSVVILSLKKWKKIQEKLENLEMHCSQDLVGETTKRRKEKKIISLDRIIKNKETINELKDVNLALEIYKKEKSIGGLKTIKSLADLD